MSNTHMHFVLFHSFVSIFMIRAFQIMLIQMPKKNWTNSIVFHFVLVRQNTLVTSYAMSFSFGVHFRKSMKTVDKLSRQKWFTILNFCIFFNISVSLCVFFFSFALYLSEDSLIDRRCTRTLLDETTTKKCARNMIDSV